MVALNHRLAALTLLNTCQLLDLSVSPAISLMTSPLQILRAALGALVLGLGSGAMACTAPVGSFCVDYFAGKTLGGVPLVSASDGATVSHNWGMNAPVAGVPIDNFSARWSGLFNFDGSNIIFRILGDDGIRLKVDGVVVVNGWKDQAATQYTATVPVSAGQHLVEVEYYDAGGNARVEADWQPVRSCDVPVGQFCGAYYLGTAFQGNPQLIVHEPTINHDWGAGAPAPGLPIDQFSVRWQGDFDFTPGTYKFNTTTDDGVRLLIDGTPLIDSFVPQAATTFEKVWWIGGRHRITVEYFESYGNAVAKAGWTLMATAAQTPPRPIGSNATSPLGSNLGAWSDYGTEQPFLDLFKSSRSWIPQAPGIWDTGTERAALDLDADGWVRSLPLPTDTSVKYRSVATLLVVSGDLNGVRQGGEHVVLYDGEGTLTYSLGGMKIAAKSRPGRDVINVDPNQAAGVQISIMATDPNHTGNYLRNIRVVPAGTVCTDDPLALCLADNDPACARSACQSTEAALNAGQLFHPSFLRTQVSYRLLRAMQAMSANVLDSTLPQPVEWVERHTLSSARWNGQAGAPLEVVTALSNQVQADAWVNMPHRASDDYMRKAARMMRDQLALGRKVYVEYGNEIWNTAFSAGSWVEAQGQLAWPGGTDSGYTKRINWYGKRSAEMCDIWKTEWAGDTGRVVCVMGAQIANTWTATAALDCALWSAGKPCQNHGIEAIAIAPYFGMYIGSATTQAVLDSWLLDADGGLGKLFTEIQTGGMLPGGPAGGALAQTRTWVQQHAAVAQKRNLKLVAYEGGQSLVGLGNVINDAGITNLLITANRDPRMKDAYTRLLNDWLSAGGDLFVNFQGIGAPGRYGSWGVLENALQPTSPKFEALQDYITAHPR
jgi:hypothetical protein